MPTINDLRQQAAIIKNATQVGENTATRVGTTFETIADLLEGASVGQGVPSVDLSQLNTLRTPTDQTTANPTVYNVTTLHNLSSTTIKVGTLFIFSDGGRAVVTQILLSNYQVDGWGNISSPNTSQITMYYRMFNIVQETWSAWTLYAGGGGGGTIDPYPVSGSDNAVASNGVFEGLQKAAPEVNINDLDDLDDYVNMQTGEASMYTIKAYHNLSSTWLRVGVLMVFANQAQNTLTQICISNCMVDGGGNLIPNYATNVMNVFYRFKQFSGNPPEGMTIGVWTTWAKFGDSGYQPDNEDIDLNASDQLQFANKSYDASAFSGLGRVYLRKNIVELNLTDKYFDGFVNNVLVQNVGTSSTPDEICFDTTRKMFVARVGLSWYLDWSSDEDYNPITGDVNWNYNGNFYRWNGKELAQWDKTINQLTQAMVNTANTIYHIQYDYDLNGQTITLPAGCILKFEGGSLRNGTLKGTNTAIEYTTTIFDNIDISGTWYVPVIRSSMFANIERTNEIKKLLKLCSSSIHNNVYIEDGEYSVATLSSNLDYKEVVLNIDKESTDIVIDGTIKLEPNKLKGYYIFNINAESVSVSGSGKIIGDALEHDYNTLSSTHEWGYGICVANNSQNIKILGITIECCTGDGICIQAATINTIIENIKISYCRRQGITICGDSVEIKNFVISNIGDFTKDEISVSGTLPMSAIDIEPDLDEFSENILIENGQINDCYNGVVCYKNDNSTPNKNIEVSNIVVNRLTNRFIFTNCENVKLRHIIKSDDTFTVMNITNCSDLMIDYCYYFNVTGNSATKNLFINNSIISIGYLKCKSTIKNSQIDSINYQDPGTAPVDIYGTLLENCTIKKLQDTSLPMPLRIAYNAFYGITFKECNFYNVSETTSIFATLNSCGYVFDHCSFYIHENNENIVKILNFDRFTSANGTTCDVINCKINKPSVRFADYTINFVRVLFPSAILSNATMQNTSSVDGSFGFNTTIQKMCVYVGKWTESDGATAGVNRSGTFASKPAATDIYVGFKYFCTDKQTAEGQTNGIEIIHKGNDVWVDALGRVIS